MSQHDGQQPLLRVSVAELLGYASMDADPHRPGPACPQAGPGRACVREASRARS